MEKLDAPFPRGKCPVYSFGPEDRKAPVVLFFPDAFGPRPTSFAVAEELAAEGWRVLMLDQFYQHIPYEPLTPKSLFEEGPERDRVMTMFMSIDLPMIDEDVAAMIALAESRSDPGTPFAATGYCMGGRYALSAVTASERVVFAGAFHASNIAPAEGDSPHLRFAKAKGRIYIAPAGTDPTYDAAEHGRLAQALREADTDHVIENYKGAMHGWVYPDLAIYDEAAANKHMRRLKENLSELFTS